MSVQHWCVITANIVFDLSRCYLVVACAPVLAVVVQLQMLLRNSEFLLPHQFLAVWPRAVTSAVVIATVAVAVPATVVAGSAIVAPCTTAFGSLIAVVLC